MTRYHLAIPDQEPAGAILVLGGSEGGHHPEDADAFAQAGFVALSWQYFTPKGLVDVPIEQLVEGVDMLATTAPGTALGVTGGSRGSEAALILSVVDSRIKAVVSVVGSGVVTSGIDYSRGDLASILSAGTNSWRLRGEPYSAQLPNVSEKELSQLITADGPLQLRNMFSSLEEVDISSIAIPVEHSDAAILFISASNDRMWDSPGLSQVAYDRLTEHHHPRAYDHIVIDSGHPIAGAPRPQRSTISPGPGVEFDLGGTVEGNMAGQQRAWELTLSWFHKHLGSKGDTP